MTAQLTITFRIRRRWLLRLATWVERIHPRSGIRIARHTIVEFHAAGRWHRIDMEEALP